MLDIRLRLKIWSYYLLGFIIVVSILVLIGWQFDIYLFKRMLPQMKAMNPTSAATFLLTAASFYLLIQSNSSKSSTLWGNAIAIAVFLIGGIRLAALLFHLPIAIDQFLFAKALQKDTANHLTSGMAPNTALNFMLSGIALLMIRSKRVIQLQSLALVIFLISLFAIVGYIYKVPEFYGLLAHLPMAMHTAICFSVFSVALLFIRGSEGIMKELTTGSVNSSFARIIIPTAVFIPILFGYLRLLAHWKFEISTEFGVAILVMSILIFFTTIVWINISLINRQAKKLIHSETEVHMLNTRLNDANERLRSFNEELMSANEELTSFNEELYANNEQLMVLNDQLGEANGRVEEQSRIILQQKDEQLNRVLDSSNDVIWSYDLTGKGESYISRSAVRIYGKPLEELLNHPKFWIESVLEEDRHAVDACQKELEETGFAECTYRIITKGHIRWMHDQLRMIKNEDGKVQRMEGIASDITHLKDVEEKLDIIFSNTTEEILLMDSEGKVILFNKALENFIQKASGKKPAVGDYLWQTTIPERSEAAKELFFETLKGKRLTVEAYFNMPDGQGVHELRYEPIWIDQKVKYVTIIANDITEKKRREVAFQKSEAELRAIFESTLDGFILIDKDYSIITFNNASRIGFNRYLKKDLQAGENILELLPDDRREKFFNYLKQVEEGNTVEYELRYGSGEDVSWFKIVLNQVVDQDKMIGFCLASHDLTSNKKVEEESQQNKLLLEKADEVAHVGYWINDLTKGKITWSKETLQIVGLNELDFDGDLKAIYKLIFPDDRKEVRDALTRAINEGIPFDLDHRIIRPDGVIRWVHEKAEMVVDARNEVKFIGIVQDITERKMSEEILKEYNQRYEFLSRATNDAVWDWDIRHDFEIWNHGLENIFGYTQREVLSTHDWWIDKIHPEDYDRVVNEIDDAFRNKRTNMFSNYRYKCADGAYKDVLDRAYIVYDANDEPIRMIGAMQDVTERTRSLEEIRKLSLVARSTENSVMITDDLHRIEWVNESFTKLTGYTLEEVIGKKSSFLQGAETDKDVIKRVSEKLSKAEPFTEEMINYSKSGNKYWLKLSIAPVFDDEGVLKQFISVQSDVSEQKEYEKSITAIARELSNLIENANVPILGLNKGGFINEWNHVAAELLGFSREQVFGTKWTDRLIPEEFADSFNDLSQRTLKGEPISNLEIPMISREGKRVVLLMSMSPRRDGEASITGVIIVAQNITELSEYREDLEKKVEERTLDLNNALMKEKELVEMKSRFVSIASHEFRTPLSSISLASGFIRKYKLKIAPEEIDKKLENIEKQVRHMTYLLDDVLMIGKSEAGKIKVNLTKTNIRTLVENLVLEVTQITRHTHRVNLEMNVRREEYITDEKLMRNILINLLTNAIKFSPEADQVDLVVSMKAKDLLIKIKDYGVGIPPEDINKLFEPFYRAGNVTDISGTGLGLSIIKKAVDLLNGQVTVESELNSGTEFKITLPLIYE